MVADGMGGHSGGKVASNIFQAETTTEFLNPDTPVVENIEERIRHCFNTAHLSIKNQTQKEPHLEGMGCTANILVFNDQRFYIGHVGDSRTYRLRNHQLEQLTSDHSLVQQQLDLGLITQDQARNHIMRSVILRAVGISDSLEIDILSGDVEAGDLFILCTDGLYGMLDDNQLQQILESDMLPDQKVSVLIDLANGAGGKDNITLILVSIIA
jgi:protein phosphatase